MNSLHQLQVLHFLWQRSLHMTLSWGQNKWCPEQVSAGTRAGTDSRAGTAVYTAAQEQAEWGRGGRLDGCGEARAAFRVSRSRDQLRPLRPTDLRKAAAAPHRGQRRGAGGGLAAPSTGESAASARGGECRLRTDTLRPTLSAAVWHRCSHSLTARSWRAC